MKEYGPTTFGELNADDYDRLHNPGTTEASVALISKLAENGKILELAIGTGRVALPLAKRGHSISGFDASHAMLEKLNAKAGSERIPTWIADMADFQISETFDFAFLIFNTLYNLTTQSAQVSCFKCVANHLNPSGQFLVEAFMPSRYDGSEFQPVRTRQVSFGGAWIETAHHDVTTQQVHYQNIGFTPDGIKLVPLPMRYVWPSELDLMAQLAGMELQHRWGGWHQEPFGAHSKMHVSLYVKSA